MFLSVPAETSILKCEGIKHEKIHCFVYGGAVLLYSGFMHDVRK